MTVTVFSDGSSGSKSGKPIGWGWIVARDGKVLVAGYGGAESGSNNISELTAAIEGLEAMASRAQPLPGEAVLLMSDSKYVLGMASGEYDPVKNLELCQHLRKLAIEWGVTPKWVPGHTLRKHAWQEANFEILMQHRCDQLAKKGKAEFTPQETQHDSED